MKVCTIVAQNYLPQARVLAESYARHHPGKSLHVLVIDAEAVGYTGRGEPFELVRPSELPISSDEFRIMATIYSPLELATAVKPSLLRYLLEKHGEVAVYLDPDIEVFDSLQPLSDLAQQHSIVLVPHMLAPIPLDGRGPTVEDIAQAGVFNLGFVAVSPGAAPFLTWWMDRLARDCIVAPEEGLFVDQRLLDFVPGYFTHFVLRDPGYDVAYWNLHERDVRCSRGRYTVNGSPLRFFHYSGFNPEAPEYLSKHQGPNPRVVLSERPGVDRLCASYAKQLLEAGWIEFSGAPYGYGEMGNGLALDRRVRRLYREELLAREESGSPSLPDIFAEDGAASFTEWCCEPVAEGSGVNRYVEYAWRERADLRTAFPDLLGEDGARFSDWMQHPTSVFDPPIPEVFRSPGSAAVASEVHAAEHGVNVAGYFRAELGVGEAGRLLISAVRAADIPYSVVPYERTVSRQLHPFDDSGTGDDGSHDVNIICVNADQLPNFADDMGPHFFEGRYSVGLWFWEVEDFPESMRPSAHLVDEIWVASQHAANAIGPVVEKPVLVAPLPIPAMTPPSLARADLGLPDDFLFLFSFDFQSIVERKNPFGLIDAFRDAFAPGEGPVLLLKSINGDRHPAALERLSAAAGGRDDILVVDRYLTAEERQALTGLCDAYISMHRSEGLGLTMAEAMAMGKPVIGTGYSGNLAFMSAWNSILLPYDLVPIPEGCEPYPPGSRWAEPDRAAAAQAMRRVYEQPELRRELGERARADIERHHSPEACGSFFRKRLSAIAEVQRSRRVAAPATVVEEAAPLPVTVPAEAAPLPVRVPGDASLERVRGKIKTGPDVTAGRWWARPGQRIVLRTLGLYEGHQSTVLADVTKAIREIGHAVAVIDARQRDFGGAADELSGEIAALSNQVGGAIGDIRGALHELSQHHEALSGDASAAIQSLSANATSVNDAVGELSRRLHQFEELQHGAGDIVSSLQTAIAVEKERRQSSIRRLTTKITAVEKRSKTVPDLERRMGIAEGALERIEAQATNADETARGAANDVVDARETQSAVGEAIDGLEKSLAYVAGVLEGVTGQVSEAAARADEAGRAADKALTKLTREAKLRRALESRVPELSTSIDAVHTAVATLKAELQAVPFTADGADLWIPDGDGRVLAYSNGGSVAPRDDLYRAFEDVFRGPESLIRDRQRLYVDLLEGHSPVVDIGSGRGELLDLAADMGLTAIGVDIDPGMVKHSQAKGHAVEQADALEFLEAQPHESLGAVFSAQVIEHLTYEDLLRFLQLTYGALAPGGVTILETINPHSLPAMKTFWVDLTHEKPIFPETLLTLFRLSGFAAARVVFPTGSDCFETDLQREGQYAVVATKAAPNGGG